MIGYTRWTALAATSTMLFIGMALPIYGASVVNTYMVVDRGWDRETLGLLVGVNFLVVALMSPVAASLVGRLGASRTMAIGCLFMAAGAGALAFAVATPLQAIVAFAGGFGIGGSLIGIIPCQTAVAGWFVDKRTLALSILYAVMGLGGFAAAWFVNLLTVQSGDWRIGWWCLAIAAVIGLPISLFFVRESPGGAGMPAPGGTLGGAREDAVRQALRNPFLWAVFFGMLAANAASAFTVSHAQIYLRGLGFSGTDAATAISIFSAATVAGNLGFAALAHRLELSKAFTLTFIPLAIAVLLLTRVTGFGSLALVAFLLGAAFGASQVGAMSVLGHYWHTRVFPFLTAIGLIIQTIGGSLLPIGAGRYYDAYGDYRPVIYGIAMLSLLSILALFAVGLRTSKPTGPMHIQAHADL